MTHSVLTSQSLGGNLDALFVSRLIVMRWCDSYSKIEPNEKMRLSTKEEFYNS